MLLSSRVTATSNNTDVSGRRNASSSVIGEIYTGWWTSVFTSVESVESMRPMSPIYQSLQRNNVEPIMEAFKIVCENADSTLELWLMFLFSFVRTRKELSPFKPRTPLSFILGENPLEGSFSSDKSTILEVKSFPLNLNIKMSVSVYRWWLSFYSYYDSFDHSVTGWAYETCVYLMSESGISRYENIFIRKRWTSWKK